MSKHVSVKEWIELQADYIESFCDLEKGHVLDIMQECYQIGYSQAVLDAKDREKESEQNE